MYALASGGLFGVGLGQGTSKYGWVPNANSDYVFAIIGEELGLIGCLAVLGLFGLFAYAGMRIVRRSADPFVRLAAGGATIWLCGQAVINIGYVSGLLPVTGIPLPLISAGGTSLLITFFVLGMLVSFARHESAAVTAARRANAEEPGPAWNAGAPSPCPAPTSPRRNEGRLRPATLREGRSPRRREAAPPLEVRQSNHQRDERSREEQAGRGAARAKRAYAGTSDGPRAKRAADSSGRTGQKNRGRRRALGRAHRADDELRRRRPSSRARAPRSPRSAPSVAWTPR